MQERADQTGTNQDAVVEDNRPQTMRDAEERLALQLLADGLLDLGIRLEIDSSLARERVEKVSTVQRESERRPGRRTVASSRTTMRASSLTKARARLTRERSVGRGSQVS